MTSIQPEDTGAPPTLDGSVASGERNRDAVDAAKYSALEVSLRDAISIVRDNHRDLSRLNSAMQRLTGAKGNVLSHLAPLLKHPDDEVRTYTALILGERRELAAVSCLIAALSDSSTNVKAQAIESLGKLETIAAVDSLLGFVGCAEFELAFPAIEALSAIGAERAGYAIIPWLNDPFLGSVAIQAIGRLGTEDAVLPLVDLLNNAQSPERLIIAALAEIQERIAVRYGQSDDFVYRLRVAINPTTLNRILDALSVIDDGDRPAFTRFLSNLSGNLVDTALVSQLRFPESKDLAVDAILRRGPAVSPLLVESFASEKRLAQFAIVDICGRLGGPVASTFLYHLLDVDDDELLARVLQALAGMADARLCDAAFRFLDHPNDKVRRAAVAAINATGDDRLGKMIPQLLESSSGTVQDSMLKIAGYFGFSNCIDQVLALAQGANEGIRKAAIEILPCFEDPRVIDCLASAVRSGLPSVQIAAVRVLTEVEVAESMSLLLEALKDPNVWVRYNAAGALAYHSNNSAVIGPLLEIVENDPAPQVRLAAIRGLGVCGDQAVARLGELAENSNADVVAAAIDALGTIGGNQVVPALSRAAQSLSLATRRKAVTALGASRAVEAVQPLFEAADTDDLEVFQLAVTALSKIPACEAAEGLLNLGYSAPRRPAITAALCRSSETALPALAQGLHHPDVDLRWLVIDVLTRMTGPAANRLLNIALHDPDRSIRDAAVAALSRRPVAGKVHAPKGSG